MPDEQTVESLLAAVEGAKRLADEAKNAERDARIRSTHAENHLIAAEKAFVDFLVKQQPRLTDAIVKVRR